MKITQEDFDKLKQLDRIEYRQKEDKINNSVLNFGEFCSMANFVLLFFLSVLILSILYESVTFNISLLFLKITTILIGFSYLIYYILGFFLVIRRHKRIKELNAEYFSSKTEVKK